MMEIGVDNGILVEILGDDIAAGSKLLPLAGPGQPSELTAVVDTSGFGKVRITYRLNKSPRRMSRLWLWTARHAVAVPPADAVV